MEWVRFKNHINIFVEDGDGQRAVHYPNAIAQRTRHMICEMLTTPLDSSPGTLGQINYIFLRLDGSSILGSAAQWTAMDASGTTISTRYDDSTYVDSVAFTASYTATAAVNCKCAALTDSIMSGVTLVGTAARFYSTSMGVQVGSGGKIVVVWDVSVL